MTEKATIKIEKGVPLPSNQRTNGWAYPFEAMWPTDSFLALPAEGQKVEKLRCVVSSSANSWARRYAPGSKFATRFELDDAGKAIGVRCWLLVKPAPKAPLNLMASAAIAHPTGGRVTTHTLSDREPAKRRVRNGAP